MEANEALIPVKFLINKKKSHKKYMLELYAMMAEEFPEDETGPLSSFEEYIKTPMFSLDGKDLCQRSIMVHLDKNFNVDAGLIYDHFIRTHSFVIEYLIVRKDSRGAGLGTSMLRTAMRSMRRIEHVTPTAKPWIFIEADKDNTSALKFWGKMGFKVIDIKYVQPSLGEGKNPCSNLLLLTNAGKREQPLSTTKRYVIGNLSVIYHTIEYYQICCMGIPNPDLSMFESQLMNPDIREKRLYRIEAEYLKHCEGK